MKGALILLGCPVGAAGVAPAALRRARAAAHAFHEGKAPVIVASGGRTWFGRVEADVLANALEGFGVPSSAIVRERCSFSTRENAKYTAGILARKNIDDAIVVTCAWHLARALRAFENEGVRARGIGVPLPDGTGPARRAYLTLRETVASWLGH